MKRRNLLIAVAAILVMFAFAACSESVAPEDRLGTITFDNNTSRAVGTVVKYSNEVEDMYWYYSAAKQDDGYTTGDTGGKLLAVSANNSQGLSGKTLNNNFSYGLWNIELMGFKATTDVVDGAVKKDGGGIQYKATITNLLVDKGANYAKAEIQLGDNPETKIEFGAISFSAENIKASSDFTLTVEDDKGTVTVGTAAADIEKADKSVTFKNLTYTPKSGVDITGEHEMKFVLTQKLSGTDNINITAARYTLKFKVQPGTTTTISGTLVKNDETGTIEITSVQNVEPLTLSRSIPVENIQIADGVGVAKVSTPTTMQVGTMTVTLPAGTVIATKTDSVTENTSESTADNKKGDADGTIGFVKKDTAANGSVTVKSGQSKLTYELTLPVSTEEYDTSKKNTILVTVKTFVGKGLEGLEIYHGTSSTPLAAESEEKVPKDENEGYFYNADTGYLTLYVLHASEFHIVAKEATAEVNGTRYYSLSEAINGKKNDSKHPGVADGGTVTLLSNATVDSPIAIGKNITLDLKNKVVTIGTDGSISISGDKVITVENSTADQSAFINAVEVRSFSGTERSYHTSLDSAIAAVKDGGTVTLWDNVNLSKNVDVNVSATFTLKLNGKTVTASDGKQVIVKAGTMTVTGKKDGQTEFVSGIKGEEDTYYSSLEAAVQAASDNATITLLTDIDLSEKNWTPINNFSGKLDGNNHTISNLTINIDSTVGGNYGLFGETGDSIEIVDLTLSNIKITVNAAYDTDTFVGGFVGLAHNLKMSNCVIDSASVITSAGNDKGLGSFVGKVVAQSADDRVVIDNCKSSASLTGNRVGGMIGYVADGNKVTGSVCFAMVNKCTFDGKIDASSGKNKWGGGIFAQYTNGSVNTGRASIIECEIKLTDIFGGTVSPFVCSTQAYYLLTNCKLDGVSVTSPVQIGGNHYIAEQKVGINGVLYYTEGTKNTANPTQLYSTAVSLKKSAGDGYELTDGTLPASEYWYQINNATMDENLVIKLWDDGSTIYYLTKPSVVIQDGYKIQFCSTNVGGYDYSRKCYIYDLRYWRIVPNSQTEADGWFDDNTKNLGEGTYYGVDPTEFVNSANYSIAEKQGDGITYWIVSSK